MNANTAEAAELLGTYFGNVKIKESKKKATDPSTASDAKPEAEDEPLFEKDVANCLSCGRIFLLKKPTTLPPNFLSSGGVCPCGTLVNTRKQRVLLSASRATEEAERLKLERAIAFKDRLVDYDRSSAKRTTVLDDQGFAPEIDGNAWLSEQEKEAIRERLRIEEEAREKKKRQSTITIDLLGRRVIAAHEEEEGEAAGRQAEEERGGAGAGPSTPGPDPEQMLLDLAMRPADSVPLTFLPSTKLKEGAGSQGAHGRRAAMADKAKKGEGGEAAAGPSTSSGGGKGPKKGKQRALPKVQDTHDEFNMLL